MSTTMRYTSNTFMHPYDLQYLQVARILGWCGLRSFTEILQCSLNLTVRLSHAELEQLKQRLIPAPISNITSIKCQTFQCLRMLSKTITYKGNNFNSEVPLQTYALALTLRNHLSWQP